MKLHLNFAPSSARRAPPRWQQCRRQLGLLLLKGPGLVKAPALRRPAWRPLQWRYPGGRLIWLPLLGLLLFQLAALIPRLRDSASAPREPAAALKVIAPDPGVPAHARTTDALTRQLDFPWPQLLDELDRLTDPAVSITALRADPEARAILIEAVAPTEADAQRFLDAIGSGRIFTQLTRQQAAHPPHASKHYFSVQGQIGVSP